MEPPALKPTISQPESKLVAREVRPGGVAAAVPEWTKLRTSVTKNAKRGVRFTVLFLLSPLRGLPNRKLGAPFLLGSLSPSTTSLANKKSRPDRHPGSDPPALFPEQLEELLMILV